MPFVTIKFTLPLPVLSNWRVTLASILRQMVKKSLGGISYIAVLISGRESTKMEHLVRVALIGFYPPPPRQSLWKIDFLDP